MAESKNGQGDDEARDILYVSGGAALIVLGAGLILTNKSLRDGAKAALTALMPELEEPLKAGVRGVLPDVQRYLKLRGM